MMSQQPTVGVNVTRTKNMTVTPIGLQRYKILARLLDSSFHGDYGDARASPPDADSRVIHDFRMEGVVEGADLVVAELSVSAITHPYSQCPAVVSSCQTLVGRSLASQWRRTVLETLGGAAGCTHVTTLLLGLAEVRTMVFFLEMNAETPYSPETRSDGRWTATGLRVAPSIVGACHVLAEGGPVIDRARQVADSQFHYDQH